MQHQRHTKTNRGKMKQVEFVKNIRTNGVDGKSIPEHILELAYNEIKGAEITQAAPDPAELPAGGTTSYSMHDDSSPEEADNAARVFALNEPLGPLTMTGVVMVLDRNGRRGTKTRYVTNSRPSTSYTTTSDES